MIAWFNSLPYSITDALWIILVGATCSVACALLGCWLVLRRISLLGDAISHAVLPGLVIAFVVAGTREPLPMLIGAVAFGLLTAVLTQSIEKIGRVPEDSSMGVAFTSLFALGVVLINLYASQIDLDPGCVLYGLIEFVGLYTVPVAGIEMPRALLTTSGVLALVIAFSLMFWKELKLAAFDPALAVSVGLSAGIMHYALMSMVAIATVASFEAVGSILVIAMLIAPGATAHLLTDRLSRMMWISAVVAVLSSVLGYWWAVELNTSVAGMMAVAAGAQFTLAVFCSPRHGLLGRAWHNRQVALRVLHEDALAVLWRERERRKSGEDVPAMARAHLVKLIGDDLRSRRAVGRLVGTGLIAELDGNRVILSETGIEEARRLIRSHRLWETYMAEEMGRSPEELDAQAHRLEHFTGPALARQLDDSLKQPQADPHGHEIPR